MSVATKQPTMGFDEPTLLHEFFERQVRLRPEHPAVEYNGEVLTYLQLDELANRIAATLRARGVHPGSLVALYLNKSHWVYAALLGVLKAGAGYVPIDAKFPIGRIQSILGDAQVSIVISEGTLGSTLKPHVSAEIMLLGDELPRCSQSTPSDGSLVVTPDDVCYVIYTSGTTGRPKGVIIEHRNVVNFVRALRTVYGLDQQDRVYQGFSIAFDASVEEIWAALSLGGTLVVPSEEIARSIFDATEFINSHGITFFSTVPSFLAMMKTDLPTVRLLVVGGEACAPELVKRWARSGRRLMNTYGPTETTVVATATDCIPGEPVTIGMPLPGYSTWVLDDQLRPVRPGESGELYIGGESVARGYVNRSELTAERFVRNLGPENASITGRFYRTSDLVRLTENGALQYLGRSDSQIKIRGFRIELSEIEAVLMEHPSIQAAAVSVVEFGNFQELAAYVVRESTSGQLDRRSIVELLRRKLPEYMIPRYLEVVSRLPITISGKVDRKLLPAPATLLPGAERTIVPPATDLERTIVHIWERNFHVSPISVEDDFFLDLHGHSLLAGHVVTDMRSALGTIQASIPDLYEYRTVRLLAAHLKSIGVDVAGGLRTEDAINIKLISDAAERPLLSWSRWLCAGFQLLGILAFYAVSSAPIVFSVIIIIKVLKGDVAFGQAAQIATIVGFLVWPSWLFLSIALKWIVIGRYRPGRYPVWGMYYFRWWLVSRFQALSWSEMFVGTPLMSLYYRAMGAKIGKNCTIGSPLCTAFDLIAIGDDTSIGSDTQILGYRVENGWLTLGQVAIGRDCFVGTHCCFGLNTTMHDRARLDDMSLVADGSLIEADQDMRGSPAKPAEIDLPDMLRRRKPSGKTFWFGLIHLGLIYAMGYLLILSAVPGLAVVGYALYFGGPAWGIGAAFAAVPITIAWYLLLVLTVKWVVIGRIYPGTYSLQSAAYLRYWFLDYLLNNTRELILPLYATLFLPQYLRLLGAKIGRNVEISTAMHVMPDLLELHDGSFLADACIVGCPRIHHGFIDICANKIGRRTFIGNSALIPAGIDVGDDGLIGVMSTPPAGMTRTPDGTRWLGSPGFELPLTQRVTCFREEQTFNPPRKLVFLRALIEALRILLPGFILATDLILFCTAIVVAYNALPLSAVLLIAPVIALVLSVASIALVAALKMLLMGTFKPTIKPLWCSYVWLNDVVNGLYETVAAAAMTPLMGTPFISPCLRIMGCKIGRWVFLETTLFSEFDLVAIGDYAALNLGSTIQTHLFEDRVMKSDYLTIGPKCSVGNMTVVLYGTEMQHQSSLAPLSVLMKGEVLPAGSKWSGIPTRPVDSALAEPARPLADASSNEAWSKVSIIPQQSPERLDDSAARSEH